MRLSRLEPGNPICGPEASVVGLSRVSNMGFRLGGRGWDEPPRIKREVWGGSGGEPPHNEAVSLGGRQPLTRMAEIDMIQCPMLRNTASGPEIGLRAGFRPGSSRESLKISPPVGLRSAGFEPILTRSRLYSSPPSLRYHLGHSALRRCGS